MVKFCFFLFFLGNTFKFSPYDAVTDIEGLSKKRKLLSVFYTLLPLFLVFKIPGWWTPGRSGASPAPGCHCSCNPRLSRPGPASKGFIISRTMMSHSIKKSLLELRGIVPGWWRERGRLWSARTAWCSTWSMKRAGSAVVCLNCVV